MIADFASNRGVAGGYGSAGYAAALSFVGRPLQLPQCEGWLLRRAIAGGDLDDACGSYPIFSCRHWPRLEEDLACLPSGLVSVAMVIDPFAAISAAELARAFPDRCIPFKSHFVRDLSSTQPLQAHHRRNVRMAAAQIEVEACERPLDYLDDWCRLYGHLVERHQISGIAAFSRSSFAAQLALPDLRAFRAVHQGRTVGMALWLVGSEAAYYHLAAYDEQGYQSKASFALFDAAIGQLRGQGCRWLDLGGAAGVVAKADDGLARFKQGWATGTRLAWFAGRICDAAAYGRLAGVRASAFFPAYRDPAERAP